MRLKKPSKIMLFHHTPWSEMWLLVSASFPDFLVKLTKIKNKSRFNYGYKQIWPRSTDH